MRKAEPYLGGDRISFEMKRLFNMSIAESTVYSILHRHELVTSQTKKRLTKRHIKRYRRGLPGFGQLDVKYVPQLIEGKQLYAFNFVDHCTTWRFVRVYPNLTHEYVVEFLKELALNCPFPIIEIQTDNGIEFTDKYRGGRLEPSGLHVLDLWCQENGIRHKLIPIGQKELNGKVENTHKQDDREFYSQHDFETLPHMRLLMASYIERWNTLRHTKALGRKTPAQALEAAYVRVLVYVNLIVEKFAANKNHIIQWDADLVAFIHIPKQKKQTKKGPTRSRKSAVNRYLKYDEWSRKKSS